MRKLTGIQCGGWTGVAGTQKFLLNGDHHTIPNNLIPENFGLLAFEWALEIMWLNSVSLQNMRELLQGEENSPGSDS